MSNIRSILQSSMEDLGQVELINPVTANDTTDIDAALQQIDTGAGELEAADEVVEILTDASVAVESLLITLESCIAEGGMTPQTARSHKQAVGFALARMPNVDLNEMTVSTEAFGGTGDKVRASLESAAGLKAFLKKVLDALIKAVKSAWESASKFVKSMGDAGPALVKNAKLLKAKASSMKGVTTDRETIDVPACAAAFHMDGAFNGNIVTSLNAIVLGGKGVSHAAEMAAEYLGTTASSITTADFEVVDAIDALVKILERANPTGVLPGGYHLELNDKNVFAMVKEAEYSGSTDVKIPTIETVVMIADRIEQVAKVVVEFEKKSYKALEANVQRLMDAASKAVAAVSEEDKEKGDKLKAALQGLNELTTVARSVGPQYIRYMIAASKTALGYGGSVLRAYASAN